MTTTDPNATGDPVSSLVEDRRRLEETRDKLMAAIDAGTCPDLPAYSRELRQVLAALRDLPAPAGASGVDQIRAARERRAAAS